MADGTQDDFEKVFAELAAEAPAQPAGGEPQGDAAAPDTSAVPTDGGASAQPNADAGQAPSAEGDAGGEQAGADAAPAATGGDADAAAQKPAAQADGGKVQSADADEVINRLASLIKQAPAQEQQAPQQQAAEPPPIYTPDEQEFLTEYEKDWPDVAKAEALRRRAEYRELTGFIFQTIGPHIQRLNQMAEQLAARAHYTDLKETVGEDYDTLADQVEAWVDEQPSYLKSAYKNVVVNGTPDEVKDLIDRFKREKGVVQTAPQQQAAPTAPPKKVELPTATKQAADLLAPVDSKRSAVASGSLNDMDFEAAFKQFADKM